MCVCKVRTFCEAQTLSTPNFGVFEHCFTFFEDDDTLALSYGGSTNVVVIKYSYYYYYYYYCYILLLLLLLLLIAILNVLPSGNTFSLLNGVTSVEC